MVQQLAIRQDHEAEEALAAFHPGYLIGAAVVTAGIGYKSASFLAEIAHRGRIRPFGNVLVPKNRRAGHGYRPACLPFKLDPFTARNVFDKAANLTIGQIDFPAAGGSEPPWQVGQAVETHD